MHLGREVEEPFTLQHNMTNIRLTNVSGLADADWRLWLDIQRGSPAYQSPYFRPEFTQAVAAVRGDLEIAVLEQDGQTAGFFPFQRGGLNLGKPVGGKLSDYHGPILREGANFNPQQVICGSQLATWDFDHLIGPSSVFEPFITVRDRSPYLDLRDGYTAYVRQRREAGSEITVRAGQKARKLARECGPLRFEYDDADPAAYEQLLAWKSAQYERTGLADVFSFPWTRELLERLRQQRSVEFSAPLAVLYAGDRLAAVCLSLRSRGVLHAWFTAYNPQLERYSPGLLLFLQLAERAESLGLHQIDLGRGDERYKWSLASAGHEVYEGTVACPSLGAWLRSGWRRSRDWMQQSPLKETVKLIKPFRQWLAYR
jgi:CelD/BcsL family acetyltransferase involved in cellulose biosynthesis